jgi:hypothetical protein
VSEDVSSESDPVTVEEAKPDKWDGKDGDDSTPPEDRKK